MDSSGNANHGAVLGGATWEAGRIGRALRLDGSTQWVAVPYSATIERVSRAGQFTIAAWVWCEDAAQRWGTILSQQSMMTQFEHFSLTTFDRRLVVIAESSVTLGCTGSMPIPTAAWRHVAGTFDGVRLIAYVDGVQVCAKPAALAIETEARPIVLGGNTNGGNRDPGELFRGLLDEVLLYDRPLAAGEVAALAAGGAPPP